MSALLPWETAPERYAELFADKATAVAGALAPLGLPEAQHFRSPPEGYRARAEFRVWHDGDDLYYAMFDPARPREPARVAHFGAALPVIQRTMTALIARLRDDPVLRKRLFQAEFMGTQADDLLVTLAYHRSLDSVWEQRARALAQDLQVSIVGRSRKQKIVLGRDYVVETFCVRGETFSYRQYEQAFAQPNAPVNELMLNWAASQLAGSPGDLLELYCGNGNFTLPLARQFRSVVATELSKSGVRAATENIAANGAENVAVVRLSAEEVSQAMRGEREFRRLAALPQPLADYALDTVFVDPPRAGLDAETLDCVRGFERILYISCNPKTLRANLEELAPSHRAGAFALFDQFPYTPHMECGVLLHRR